MGREARANRAAFFKQNPRCAFCGGETLATTKEHCPPRALFQNKEWPEGFEFPACEQCNHGTTDHDVLVAMLARLDPIHDLGDRDGRLTGMLRNASNQHPGLLRDMVNVRASAARRIAREYGIPKPKGTTYRDMGIVNVTDHMDRAVTTLSRKLTKAIYYRETGHVFPVGGEIYLHWFTNTDLFKGRPPPVLDAFAHIEATVPRLVRNKKSLVDQFDYRLSFVDEPKIALLRAVFGRAFGSVTMAAPNEGVISRLIAEMKTKTGNDGPFVCISS